MGTAKSGLLPEMAQSSKGPPRAHTSCWPVESTSMFTVFSFNPKINTVAVNDTVDAPEHENE